MLVTHKRFFERSGKTKWAHMCRSCRSQVPAAALGSNPTGRAYGDGRTQPFRFPVRNAHILASATKRKTDGTFALDVPDTTEETDRVRVSAQAGHGAGNIAYMGPSVPIK